MDEQQPGQRKCPECGRNDYAFRGRKKVQDEQGEAVETKYSCNPSGKEWRVTV